MPRALAASMAFAIAASLLACSSSDDRSSSSSGPSPSPTPPNGAAKLRVVHASPDAPAVDVWADGVAEPLVKALAYGASSAYLNVPAGSYHVVLRASPSKASDPIAFDAGTLTLANGASITTIASGLLGSKDEGARLRVLALADQLSPASASTARVRVVHASADAPTVGLDVGNDDPTKPEVAALARFADTGAAGIELPAGKALAIGVVANGQRVTSFTTPALPAGADLVVIATGLLARPARLADGFALLAVGPDGSAGFVKQDPVVFALHASPDAPAVDAFAGNAKLIDGLAFGAISGALQVPPGTYTLDFFAHGAGSTRPAGSPAASASTGALAAGERYLAIATGFLAPKSGEPAFELLGVAEQLAVDDAQNARVRIVHASPDAPAVDIGVAANGGVSPVLVPNLAFGKSTAAEGASIPPASLKLGVAAAGMDAKAVATFPFTATAGARAIVVAAGALGQNRGQAFRLVAIDTTKPVWAAASVSPE